MSTIITATTVAAMAIMLAVLMVLGAG